MAFDELPDLEQAQTALPAPPDSASRTDRDAVGYTSEAERCASCSNFDDERMYCNLNKFECEPGGHCQKFEVGKEGAEGDDDLGSLEEVADLE